MSSCESPWGSGVGVGDMAWAGAGPTPLFGPSGLGRIAHISGAQPGHELQGFVLCQGAALRPQAAGQSGVDTGEQAGVGVVLRVGPVVVRQTWPEFALGLVAVATGAGGREQRLPFLDRGGVLVVGVFAGLLECLDGSRLGLLEPAEIERRAFDLVVETRCLAHPVHAELERTQRDGDGVEGATDHHWRTTPAAAAMGTVWGVRAVIPSLPRTWSKTGCRRAMAVSICDSKRVLPFFTPIEVS